MANRAPGYAAAAGGGAANLAPFNPSSGEAVALALAAAALQPGDVLYDLGCGDGRLLLAAATAVPGLACVGVEYDPAMAARAAARARQWAESGGSGSASTVTIVCGDATCVPLQGGRCPPEYAQLEPAPVEGGGPPQLPGPATVIFCYLVPTGLTLLEPLLRAALLGPGRARVITNMFRVPGWVEETRLVTKEGLAVYAYSPATALGGPVT